MSRILITGATGNVGSAVIQALARRGISACAAVRTPRPGALAEQVVFDFERPETYGPALEGVDKLFLMRPPALTDVARYVFPVIDEAKRRGVSQIVFLSLLGAQHLAFVPHRKIELYLERCGLSYTFLRASFFMQNLSTTHADEILDQRLIDVPAGTGKTSFVDVDDLAEVAALALTEPGHANQAYDLTGNEALDYHEVAALLTRKLGRPIVYRAPGLLDFLVRRVRSGVPVGFALVMGAIYTTARMGKAALVTSDLERLLGRSPRTLESFLAGQNKLI
jgi:uncharacterized protein YbjT (DUF2867 family)